MRINLILILFRKWKSIGVNKVTFYKLATHNTKNGELINIDEWYKKEKDILAVLPGEKALYFLVEKSQYVVEQW